jgi:hypothetical protein
MYPVATSDPLPPNDYTGLSSCVSVNTAAALKVGKQRLTYQPSLKLGLPQSGRLELESSGMELRIDGALVDVGLDGIKLDDASVVYKDYETGEVRVEYSDKSSVKIIPTWWAAKQLWYLDFDVTPPEGAMGIAGPVPNNSWLPLLPGGGSVGLKPSSLHDRFHVLYEKFAGSWRVNDQNTLFDYAPGTSSKTYTMEDWPRENGNCKLPFQVPRSGVSLNAANAVCAGLINPRFKDNCVQDVSVTGDAVFASSYLKLQGPITTTVFNTPKSDYS